MLIGIKGIYAGAEIPTPDKMEIVIGRDPKLCNLVYDRGNTIVSRCHCSVVFREDEDRYYLTDYSKNGTYTLDGKRFIPNCPVPVERGTVICIGSKAESFRLD